MRKLTLQEIEDIIDFIKPVRSIPEEASIAIMEKGKDKFRNQLNNQLIYPNIIPKLKEQLKKNYFSSLIQPGESVGIIAAQSIGEKNTQSTLNSIDWKEKILYIKNDNVFVEPIGKMVDELLLKFPDNIQNIKETK